MFIRGLPVGKSGDVTPGSGSSGFTSGAVIIANSSGELDEDATHFFYNSTTKKVTARSHRASSASATTDDVFMEWGDGQTVPVSNASEGRIRYNASVQSFQVSENGNAWADLSVGGTAYLQNGNAFGATGVLGLTDANTLNIITNNTTQISIASGGNVTFTGSIIGPNGETFDNATNNYWTSSGGFVAGTASQGFRLTGMILNADGTTVYLQGDSGKNTQIYSSLAAGSASTDITLKAGNTRTNGLILDVLNNATSLLNIAYDGNVGIGATASTMRVLVSGTTDAQTNIKVVNSGTSADVRLGVYGAGLGFAGMVTSASMELRTNNTARATWSALGNYALAPGVASSGAVNAWTLTAPANTGQTASTEADDVVWNLARTVTWATGAIGSQKGMLVAAPTWAFAGASTITNAMLMDFGGAPNAGSNATFTTTSIIRVGSAASIGPTSASMTYAAIRMPAHTVTVTGSTQVTSTPGFAGVSLEQITVTDSSAVTVTNSATLYIADAPVAGGSVTLTKTAALHIGAGQTFLPLGTVSLPSLAWLDGAGARTTGIYVRQSDDVVAFTTTGTAVGYFSSNFGGVAGMFVGDPAVAGSYTVVKNGAITDLKATSSNFTFTVNKGIEFVQSRTDASGGAMTAFTLTPSAATGSTASTEAVDMYINLNRTVQFATGALGTQRAIRVTAPTYGFVGASTLTTAVTYSIDGAPSAGTNATLTETVALRILGTATLASGADVHPYGVWVPNYTLTLTGTTQLTGTGPAAVAISGGYTITDGSAVTVDVASALYIGGSPVAGGSVTITKSYSLFIDSGLFRYDNSVALGGGGTATLGTVGGSGPAGTAQVAWMKMDINGTTSFVPYWQ